MEGWEGEFERLADAATQRGLDIAWVLTRLRQQVIELPSWAVGNSGTRYGTFRNRGAAQTIWHKIDDCTEIQRVVGICPVMASHVSWDRTDDGYFGPVRQYAAERGLRIGTVHPNTFMGQQYRLGSVCNPFEDVRNGTIAHFVDCVRIAREMGSRTIGIWLADGTNYPGQDSLRERKKRLLAGLSALYNALDRDMTLLVEYKPFEPSFYTTDLMDWGMSFMVATRLGEKAKVLVDLGHHLPGANIEHIIAVLLDEGKLGGFHLNARKYADDDLIVGSINPLELFLIYDQIVGAEVDGLRTDISYMLDQSHNIEPSIEGIIVSLMNAQAAYAKALLVDRPALREAQRAGDVILANSILMAAFETDVRPLLAKVRVEMGRDVDPLAAYRRGGYAQRIAEERKDTGINTLGGA